MSPANYAITEPHPTLPVSKYTHSGRGGFGNTFKAPFTTPPATARGPASLFELGLPTTSSSRFSTGRGGAGNIHNNSEKATYSFNDELERRETRERRLREGGLYHVGRGGAGNWGVEGGDRMSERKGSVGSERSGSVRSGFWGRLSGVFERR